MTAKKKIIFVTTISNTLIWHLKNIIERAAKDFDVYVIGDDIEKYNYLFENVKLINLKIERKPKLLLDFFALIKLIIYYAKINPDVSHSIMPKSGLLASIASIVTLTPIRLHSFTGQVWANYDGAIREFYKLIDITIIKLNTLCLTDSPSQSDYLKSNRIYYRGKIIPVIRKGSLSGVDIKKYNTQTVSSTSKYLFQKLGLEEDDFVFAYIARKTKDKGAIDMLEAFKMLAIKFPKVKLLFIGPIEDNSILDFINREILLSKNIFNIDAVKNHFDYINISNILCLPSHREGFGSIIIDAGAMGVPSIGYEIPGLIDSIVDNQTGILVPKNNICAFSIAMEKLYLDKNLREQLGKNALSRVNKYFSADIIYADLKMIYDGSITH